MSSISYKGSSSDYNKGPMESLTRVKNSTNTEAVTLDFTIYLP